MKKKLLINLIGFTIIAGMFLTGCSLFEPLDGPGMENPYADMMGNTEENTDGVSGADTETSTDNTVDENVTASVDTETISEIDWNSGEEPTAEQLRVAARNYSFSDEWGCGTSINGFGTNLQADSIYVNAIKDVLTGETCYYTAYYKTFNKVQRDDYTEYESSMTSRLYGVDGTLISDWEELSYIECSGDWVYKQKYQDFIYESPNYEEAELINIKTGESLKGISRISKIDNEHILVERTTGLLYILDKDGKIIFDGEELESLVTSSGYVYSMDKYIAVVSSSETPCKIYFLGTDGTMLGYISDVWDTYIYNDMITYPYVSVMRQIYDLSAANGGELVPVASNPLAAETLYYDGELAIYRDYDEAGKANDWLCQIATNTPISEKYSAISIVDRYYLPEDEKHKATEYFYARNDQGIDKLDRKGQVVAHIDLANICQASVYTYGINCYLNNYEKSQTLTLDLELVDMGKYNNLDPIYEYTGSGFYPTDLWTGFYSLNNENRYNRVDILTADMKPIITGASSVGPLIDGTISVTKGQNIGVIDLEGNWIIKYSKNEFLNVD